MRHRRRRAVGPPPGRARLPDAVDEEVRFHLERRVERLVREGMAEEDARAEALRRFGDVDRVKAKTIREGRMSMIERALWDRLRQDARYALRQIVRNPGFTTVSALTLALGIGATTAIFSVADGILFRPLPFPEPERLVAVWEDYTRRGGPPDEWGNFPDYHDLEERSRSLEAVGVWGGGSVTLTGRGEPEQLRASYVSADMLSEVLGVTPALGRGLRPEDDRPGAPGAAILTDGLWRRAFGADPSVVGETLSLNDETWTVVGVMGPDFRPPFNEDAELWLPMRQDLADHGCPRANACLRAVARLASGATLGEARREATAIARDLEVEHPEANRNVGFTLRPLRDDMVADARTGVLVLLSAVGFVLLLACANVANLLLARAEAREGEIAVRSALGAGRGRLTSQLLVESALLAVLGGGAGLFVAFLGTDLLVSLAPPGTPRIEDVGVDGRVLAFMALVTVAAGALFGVVPSLRTAGADPNRGLREGGRGGASGPGRMRSRGLLVAGQVAVALVLLVGAGLLVRSLQNLRARELGFQPEGVLTVQVGLPSARYPDADALRAFRAGLDGSLAALPGVSSVGTTSWLPLTGFGSDVTFNVEGRPLPPSGRSQAVWYRRVTPGYLEAMGLRLVAGRWVEDGDGSDAPRVVVVNDGLARRFFPDEDPVGRRLNLGDPENPTWREIVGVVAEARYFGIRGDSRDALYLPYDQAPSRTLFTALRSERDAAALAGEVRGAVAGLDPSLAVARIRTMESVVADALGPDRFVTALLSLFAGVALVLAVVGLYGVVSYSVARRQREIGVRVALGAGGWEVRRLVLGGSLGVVGAGLVVGVAASLALTRLMESLLFDVGATDPSTYVGVALTLVVAAFLASALPARRAARVDPVRALRTE